MKTFNELNATNSTIFEVEGVEFRTTQDPYPNDSGNQYIAQAIDADGNTYQVRWDVLNFDTTDESEVCNWNNPSSVILAGN
jgi:hypothetical protein